MKTNLSLDKPKRRKRKRLILKDTRDTLLNLGQLTRFPNLLVQTKIGNFVKETDISAFIVV